MIETLHGAPFPTIFVRYNSVTSDDPVGTTSPGANFAVRGLQAAPGDPDGFPGEIIFPTALVGTQLQLRENLPFTALGMPRDLDLKNGVDAANHAGDYKILPVRIRVRWSGANGSASRLDACAAAISHRANAVLPCRKSASGRNSASRAAAIIMDDQDDRAAREGELPARASPRRCSKLAVAASSSPHRHRSSSRPGDHVP
jgi:hypothetical protein